jgi:hypothetical protein
MCEKLLCSVDPPSGWRDRKLRGLAGRYEKPLLKILDYASDVNIGRLAFRFALQMHKKSHMHEEIELRCKENLMELMFCLECGGIFGRD